MEEFNINKIDTEPLLRRIDEFTDEEVVIFNVDSSPKLTNVEALTIFGITNGFGYKFETGKPFPIGSLLKVKCTTKDGKVFTVSETECGDIRHADIFTLPKSIPILAGLENRDIEVILEVTSPPNEDGYKISNMNRYNGSLKAVLNIERYTDMSSTLEKNQKVLFEGIVDSYYENPKNNDYEKFIIQIGGVNITCYSEPKFDSSHSPDVEYLETLTPMPGDVIQVNGNVYNPDLNNLKVNITWCRSISLIKPGKLRKVEIQNAKFKYNILLKLACDRNIDAEERKIRLCNLIYEMYDFKQNRIGLSKNQFLALEKVLQKNFTDLNENDRPVILGFLNDISSLGYLMAFVQGTGKHILLSSKTEFKKAIIDFYSDDDNLEKIEHTIYPLILLNKVFKTEELADIINPIIRGKKEIYNEGLELSFKQRYVFDALLKTIDYLDISRAKPLVEYLLKDIINGNYKKRKKSDSVKDDGFDGYDVVDGKFFEFEISEMLHSFLYNLKKKGRQDLIELLIAKNGLICKVIDVLNSDNAYRYPSDVNGYNNYFEKLITTGQHLLDLDSK